MLRNKTKALCTLFLCALGATTAQAEPTYVPQFDGQAASIQAPHTPKPAAKRPASRTLFDAVSRCYPEASYFRGEIALQGRAQTTRAATLQASGQLETGSRVNLALVVSVPLYSAIELDRERTREYQRRSDAAKAVGDFVQALAERDKNRRELELFKALESRSKERVAIGVAETAEQVGYLQKVAEATGDLIKANGDLEKSRLTLLGQCASDSAHEVEALVELEMDK